MSHVRSVVGRLYVVLWNETTISEIDEIRRAVPQHRRACGEPVIYVSISDGATPPPGDQERKALVSCAEEIMPSCESLYMVLRADGFRGSVLRSAMAGMMLLSKHRKQVHVVGSMDEVLFAEAQNLGVEPDVARRQLMKDGVMLPRDAGSAQR